MWDKISDSTIFVCKECGYILNPYAELNLMGYSVERAFYYVNRVYACPKCGKTHIWVNFM